MKKIVKNFFLAIILQNIVQSATPTSQQMRISCKYTKAHPDTCIIENYSSKGKDEGAIIDLFTKNTYEMKIYLKNSSIGVLDNFLCSSFKYTNVIDFWASNAEITEVNSNALKYCKGVEKVDFSNNKIQDIDRYTFKYTRNLKHLDLSFNVLDYLDSRVFVYTKKMEYLDLGNNNLKYLQAAIFKPIFNSMQIVNIQNNRLLGVENLDNLYQKVDGITFDANYFLCNDDMFKANLIKNLVDMGCLDESSWLEMVSKVIEHDNANVPQEFKQKYLQVKVEFTGRIYEKKIENTRAELLEQVSIKAEELKEWFQAKLLESLEEKSKEINGDINEKWEHLTIEFNQDSQDIERRMKDLVVYETVTEIYDLEDQEDEEETIEEEMKMENVTLSDRFEQVMGQVAEWGKTTYNNFINLF